MQTSYRLPNPLPPLPVRKGVRGRRPKMQTIALLKAAAEAAAAAAVNGTSQSPARTGFESHLAPRPHKKRGPKPKNKVRCSRFCSLSFRDYFLFNVICSNELESVEGKEGLMWRQKLLFLMQVTFNKSLIIFICPGVNVNVCFLTAEEACGAVPWGIISSNSASRDPIEHWSRLCRQQRLKCSLHRYIQ